MRLTHLVMNELSFSGRLLIATYSCRYPSLLLENATSAQLLVGYFREDDSNLVGAVILADRYAHVKVRLLKDSHRKYCLARGQKLAYLGSSNLGSSVGEVGVLFEDKACLKALSRLHEELWEVATPVKRARARATLENPQSLLEYAI